jgi:hypothetical protein
MQKLSCHAISIAPSPTPPLHPSKRRRMRLRCAPGTVYRPCVPTTIPIPINVFIFLSPFL